jgi:FkbM family methyltransferase
MRIWGKTVSTLLHYSRVKSPYFRGKARLFHWFRRLTGTPRLIIPYGNGWISVDDEGDALERFVWLHGIHESEVWQKFASIAEHNEVFWDVGANIGTVAIQALLDSRVKEVHCFEPNPTIANILRVNLQLNGTKFTVYQVALGDSTGNVSLHLGANYQSDISSLDIDRGFGDLRVTCTTIDQIVEAGAASPTMLKVDVEGWEEQVLIGASQLLKNAPPKIIIFEAECDTSAHILNQNLSILLENSGYCIEWIRRKSGKLHQYEGRFVENYLAVREK